MMKFTVAIKGFHNLASRTSPHTYSAPDTLASLLILRHFKHYT